MNFATDLPPLISDLEKVCELPETEQLSELQQNVRHQQEVLLKVKDYLVYLYDQRDQSGDTSGIVMDNNAGSIAAAVIQELQLKKTEWVAPISQEITQLTAQKQILEREIYRLNQQYEAVLREFPQQLLGQFQGSLQTQLTKAVDLFEQRLRYLSSITHPMQGLEDAGFAASEAQTDIGRSPAEHLQAVQGNLDQSISDLDSTIHTVFSALKQDISAYGSSLTGDLRQLNGIQAVMDRAAVQQISVAPTPVDEPASVTVQEEPDSPELDSLMGLATDDDSSAPTTEELPATTSLFGNDDLGFAGDRPAPSNTTVSPTETPSAVNSDAFEFGVPNTTDALFGASPSDASVDASATTSPAETFLFGDPSTATEATDNETKVPDLKTVIATPPPSSNPTATEEAEDPTKTKTITLLTDLLEDGALNVQDAEAESAIANGDLDEDEEAEAVPLEDLNPDVDGDEVETATVTVLDPDQLTQLAADLEQFETGTENNNNVAKDNVIEVAASSADDNPWDDFDDSAPTA